jgi:hypothetical protein
VILVKNCRRAADGLNFGIARARHPLVVCIHQDVHLPPGWDHRLVLPKAFFQSAGIFAEKWHHRLPVATSCVVIDRQKRTWVLGSAAPSKSSRGGPRPQP